ISASDGSSVGDPLPDRLDRTGGPQGQREGIAQRGPPKGGGAGVPPAARATGPTTLVQDLFERLSPLSWSRPLPPSAAPIWAPPGSSRLRSTGRPSRLSLAP